MRLVGALREVLSGGHLGFDVLPLESDDLPQALQDRYTGWLDTQIMVKHWITFNDPHTFVVQGYYVGLQAPRRCSLRLFCSAGKSATEPYIVAHNVILSHETVADIYRKKYKPKQQGSIGASFHVMWFRPETNSTADIEATQRAQDFQLGWFLDPFIFGDYPFSMRSRVGSWLPKFSRSESALIKGSMDFVGINHYTTFYTYNDSSLIIALLNNSLLDSGAISLHDRDDSSDAKPRGLKLRYSDFEKKSSSGDRVEPDVNKGISHSREAYADTTLNSNKRKTSPNSNVGIDEYMPCCGGSKLSFESSIFLVSIFELTLGLFLNEDYAHTAGAVVVHQFCHVGSYAFIGGGSVDVPKYIMVAGERAQLRGLNLEGLRRHGFTVSEIRSLRTTYQKIFMLVDANSRGFDECLSEVELYENLVHIPAV